MTGRRTSRTPKSPPGLKPRAFEEICERIRDQLAAGKLRPGDKLPAERELAQQLGVSRSALREALRSLEIAGVIQLRKGVKGGAFVQSGDPASLTRVMQDLVHLGAISLADLTEARLLIQSGIVRLACERATEEDIAAIGHNIDTLEEATRLGRHDERRAAITAFYRLLALATRNEILTILVDAIAAILLRFLQQVTDELPGLIASRRRFFRHLQARDADRATRELEDHLAKLHGLLAATYPSARVPARLAQRPARRRK